VNKEHLREKDARLIELLRVQRRKTFIIHYNTIKKFLSEKRSEIYGKRV